MIYVAIRVNGAGIQVWDNRGCQGTLEEAKAAIGEDIHDGAHYEIWAVSEVIDSFPEFWHLRSETYQEHHPEERPGEEANSEVS